jgi:hypothetical protein
MTPPELVFYKDSSLIDGCAGFVIHWTEEGGFGYKIQMPLAQTRVKI